MKTPKIIISLLLVAVIWSCKNDKTTTTSEPEHIVISGNIENLKGGTIVLNNYAGLQKEINVKEDGTFLDTLTVDAGLYNIRLGKKGTELYITENAKIQITADGDNFLNTLKVTGDSEAFNSYFVKKAIAKDAFFPKMREIYSLEAEAFKARLLEDFVNTPLRDLENVTDISETLRSLEKNSLHYGYLTKLGWYGSYHPRYTEKENYKVPEWLENEVKDYTLEDYDDMTYSSDYFLMVMYTFKREAYQLKEKDSIPYREAYTKVTSDIKDQRVKNLMWFTEANMGMSATKDKKELLESFLANNTDEKQIAKIKALYEEMIKLSPGSPSPKFVNYENYAGGTTSLDDFKGKYVYIDIWATWCGPCKREIPFLEKVEEQYHGKNIEFVSISVDTQKDHDKWKQMIADKGMKGTQLIADKAFSSEFIKTFNIQGIPRFMLIDPEGNLVTANAPRPSEKKLIDLFDEHKI